MKNYHAHIYFDPEEMVTIKEVHGEASKRRDLMQVFRIVPFPVGPHPKGMFEAHFDDATKEKVLEWFRENRSGLDVLIHEETGDDHRDHSENVIWLGEELPLDFGFFDLVKRDPSKAIHK